MKNYILFPADIGTHWIGGLYYIRNIIYSMLQSEKLMERYRVLIVTTEDCIDVFNVFVPQCEMYIHKRTDKVGLQLEYLYIFWKYKVEYIYNATRILPFLRFGVKQVNWIADFQHIHYPEFFSKKERAKRDKKAVQIVKGKKTIILSSEDAKRDFMEHFGGSEEQSKVVHFVSYIEDEVLKLTNTFEQETLQRYGLTSGNYVYIPNQFWKHKNHIVVFQAIECLIKKSKMDGIQFVFSGNLNSYKNDSYKSAIQEKLDSSEISDKIVMVGFLKRNEQLTIMKHAKFIIQPSLFEGWSTVVEDAKVLDKILLLSDIAVHHEQNYAKSFFFDPHDAEGLAELIASYLNSAKLPYSDIECGIARMQRDAKEYALQLEKVFLCS